MKAIRKVQVEEIPLGAEEFVDCSRSIVLRLHISPPMDEQLMLKLRSIKGAGWVRDGVDYAAINKVSSEEILLESGCQGVWCEHMLLVVSDILRTLKEVSELDYVGPSFPKEHRYFF